MRKESLSLRLGEKHGPIPLCCVLHRSAILTFTAD